MLKKGGERGNSEKESALGEELTRNARVENTCA